MRRFLILVSFVLCGTVSVQAGVIEGKVTVLDKSGRQALTSFADTIVYLDGPPEMRSGSVEMDQTDKRFIPRLLPMVSGQTVQFANSDIFQHSVFSPHPEEPFDLGRFGSGETRTIQLKVVGPHPIYCNIHQQMVGDVYVVPNGHFTVTDNQGWFRITEVPPGTYQLKAWHILGGEATHTVDVTAGAVAVLDLTLRSQKLVRDTTDHKMKDGQDYPQKYEQDYTY